MESQLKETGNELKSFRKDKNIIDVEDGGVKFSDRILKYDVEKDEIIRKIAYYNSLRSYLKSSVDYSKLPAPSVAGIEDPNIVVNVSKLIALSTQRSEMAYAVKSEKIFKDFDNQMLAVKNVLLENIVTAKQSLQYDLATVNSKIGASESVIKQLPEDQQELIKIKRKYDLSDNIYTTFLQKRSEADIVKAANLSDIHFIDPAKDVGGGLIGPKTSVNYVLALFLGILIPLIVVLIIFFINNSIQNTEELSNLTKIPLIGVIGVNRDKTELAVYNKPKSALSESFRAIRSSLQFLYKKQNVEGAKTLMITSSVSGEGKTFCSINIATVFALSEKKTVIVGLDLRKPKLFEEFNLNNDKGVVNYLINESSVEEITNATEIPFLDVILSGPIPPNPAELIISERLGDLMRELKQKYDYIILDTPPVGLVSDALELDQYCDVTLYIVRQNFSKKDMITLLNNRVKRGELKNTSIVLNGFENKAKYGTGYGYGYGYGYGNNTYAEGYHEKELQEVIEKTSENTRMTLTLALSYGSREELIQVVKKIAHKVKNNIISEEAIDESIINQHLYTHNLPDVDLVIRTSGEHRISNFLLWQIAYAEFYFTEVLWPDFSENHLYEAIISYQKRERRFGKTSEQIIP